MALVLTMLAVAFGLGVTVRRPGIWVYATLFLVACVVSSGFILLYFRLFF